ncbi:MAG: serine/threonine-protein kinase [Candidatus Hydrogenedentota bacterium]
MKVKTKHFGRMCRCTKCNFPIYVTFENVSPPVDPKDDLIPKFYSEDNVPIRWKVGDLITELYQVKEILGEGGMGTVYRLEHRGWGKMMAVKCPSGSLNRDPIWAEQYEHECETWINLSPHPNVVECYYMRRMGGLPRLFAEYVDGPDLDHLISQKTIYHGARAEVKARMMDIAIQYCWGLHHAHQEGLVHQDVKPSNLLVGSDGIAKVTDFGLAMVHVGEDGSRGSTPDSGLDGGTLRGSTGGTPTYRSNDHRVYENVTLQTDIWSWGVTMIEMFSGDVYWTDGTKANSVLDNLLKHGSRYDIIPIMPPAFESLLRRCFQEDRELRPPDMLSIANEIKDIFQQQLGRPYDRPEPVSEYTPVDILNNQAVSLLDLGQAVEAEALLQEVLAQEAGHIEANYNRGLLLWRRGLITDTQMLKLMEQLCESYPKEWLPRYLLAQVCMERGDCIDAQKILEPIARDDEYHRDVAFCQAMAYHFENHDKQPVWHYTSKDLQVAAVAISTDSRRVLAGGLDGIFLSLDVVTRDVLTDFRGHTDRVHSIQFSISDGLVVSASADETVRLWNAGDGRLIHTLSGHQGAVRQAVISHDEKRVLSGSEDGTARYWDATSGELLHTLTAHHASVWSVALSHCGRYAFTGSSDGTVIQWDVASGKGMCQFTSKRDKIWAVAVNTNSTQLIVSCGSAIEIWDVATARLKRTIEGHQHDAFGLSVSQSGIHALSATQMGTMKVWDIETGQCIRSLKANAPIQLTPDGTHAISGGAHGDFTVWALHMDERIFTANPMICH